MNDNIQQQQPPVSLPSPQGKNSNHLFFYEYLVSIKFNLILLCVSYVLGYPPQAYPNGIYPLAVVYPSLPQGHVYVQGIGYYPPQGYPHPIGMRYPPQIYHLPQYDAPPHGQGQGYPPQKQKQNQATISVMGGWYALHLQSPYIIHHCLSL